MLRRKKINTTTGKLSKKFKRDSEADDLPDITPALMKDLKSKWVMEDALDCHPVSQMVNTVRQHLDTINPYIEVVRHQQQAWHEAWLRVYSVAEQLDHAVDDAVENRYYSVPEELKIKELQAHSNLGRADSEWEEAKLQYSIEIDKRNNEILEIQNTIKLITETKDLGVLSKYDVRAANESAKASKHGKFTSLFSAFGYHPVKPVVTDKVAADEEKLKCLRDRLLLEYNDNLIFKANNLKEYADNAPVKPTKYRHEWNAVKAQILHHQLEFYRCQSKEVMLNCIRLYMVASRAYELIYGERPLVDQKKRATESSSMITKIQDEDDKIVAKAKDMFKQLMSGMNNQLSSYYCLQPNRCEFVQYRDNFNRIPSADVRDAILAGTADDDMLAAIFTEFETPLEAFQLSSTSPSI